MNPEMVKLLANFRYWIVLMIVPVAEVYPLIQEVMGWRRIRALIYRGIWRLHWRISYLEEEIYIRPFNYLLKASLRPCPGGHSIAR